MTNEDHRQHADASEGELRFIDVVAVLVRRWKTVALLTAAAVAVSIPVALAQPRLYLARVVAVPVADAGGSRSALIGQLPGSMAALLGGSGQPTNQRLVTDVLKSRTLAEHIAERLEPESEEGRAEVLQAISRGLRVDRSMDGTSIGIDVRSDDPERSAAIANQVPASVNEVVSRLSADAAQRRREFLMTSIETARENLIRSEQRMLEFQQRHSLPEVATQAERTMDAATQIQQVVLQQELVVAQLRRTSTPENPQLRAAIAELNARRQQLRQLTSGAREGSLFVSLAESPELKVEATRLHRDYTRDEQVYVSLAAGLAEADIGVKNDMPVITILDPARVPGAPISRTRTFVMVAGVLGLVLGLAVAFGSEYASNRRRRPATPLDDAWDQVRGDFVRDAPGRRSRTPAGTLP